MENGRENRINNIYTESKLPEQYVSQSREVINTQDYFGKTKTQKIVNRHKEIN